MKFLKYFLLLALFAGITLPLLTSCCDDEDSTPIEGYWYANLWHEPEMIVFKDGKFAAVYPTRGDESTAQMKKWVDEAFKTHKVENFGGQIEYGTYTISGNKLVLNYLSSDENDVEKVKVSLNDNTLIITWYEDEYTVYQRYTGK